MNNLVKIPNVCMDNQRVANTATSNGMSLKDNGQIFKKIEQLCNQVKSALPLEGLNGSNTSTEIPSSSTPTTSNTTCEVRGPHQVIPNIKDLDDIFLSMKSKMPKASANLDQNGEKPKMMRSIFNLYTHRCEELRMKHINTKLEQIPIFQKNVNPVVVNPSVVSNIISSATESTNTESNTTKFSNRKRANNNSTVLGDSLKKPKLDNEKLGPFVPNFGEEVPQPNFNVGSKPKKASKGEGKDKNNEQKKKNFVFPPPGQQNQQNQNNQQGQNILYQNFNINNSIVNPQPAPKIVNSMEGSKFHVNVNLTTININNQNMQKDESLVQVYDKDLKLINSLKETLRKSHTTFSEVHHPDHYRLDFRIRSDNNTLKDYAIKVDLKTSKIMHYMKGRDGKVLIEIDNIEDCNEGLISSELNTVKKDLEKFPLTSQM